MGEMACSGRRAVLKPACVAPGRSADDAGGVDDAGRRMLPRLSGMGHVLRHIAAYR